MQTHVNREDPRHYPRALVVEGRNETLFSIVESMTVNVDSVDNLSIEKV